MANRENNQNAFGEEFNELLLAELARLTAPHDSLEDRQVFERVMAEISAAMRRVYGASGNYNAVKLALQQICIKYHKFVNFIQRPEVSYDGATNTVTISKGFLTIRRRRETNEERDLRLNGFPKWEICHTVFDEKRAARIIIDEPRPMNRNPLALNSDYLNHYNRNYPNTDFNDIPRDRFRAQLDGESDDGGSTITYD